MLTQDKLKWLADLGVSADLLGKVAGAGESAALPSNGGAVHLKVGTRPAVAPSGAASSSPTATPSPAPPTGQAALRKVDTPGGLLTYLATREADVKPPLEKVLKLYADAFNFEGQLDDADEALQAAAEKVPPLDAIMKDIAQNTSPETNDRARQARTQSHSDKQATLMLELLKQHVADAISNLSITRNELTALNDETKADALISEANELKEGIEILIKSAGMAKSAADPVEIVGFFVQAFSAPHIAELMQRADELKAEAQKLKADAAYDKFANAGRSLKALSELRDRAEREAKDAKDDATDDWAVVEESYDSGAKGFQFQDVKDAIAQAKSTQALAQRATVAAMHAHDAAFQLSKISGTWQGDPIQDNRAISKLMEQTKGMMEAGIFTRDKIPPVLQRLQSTYQGARKAVASAHPMGRKR